MARKRKVQTAIQLPFLTNNGANYLLKMKEDTLDFHQLFSNDIFNFTEGTHDPFLVQVSMLPKKNIAAGGGLRSLMNRKQQDTDKKKIVLPLDNHIATKARACQEMIMYERTGSNSSQNGITDEFKQTLQTFEKSLSVNDGIDIITA